MEENGKIKVCFVKFRPEHKKTYLFEMPYGAFLNKGDTVIVPDVTGNEVEAIVTGTERYDLDSYPSDKEELERLLNVAGVELPLKKVLGTVEREYFKYKGGDTNEDDDN